MAIYLSHPNPVAPVTAPTADDLHNAYSSHGEQIRSVSEQKHSEGFDPYAAPQDTQKQQQDEHAAAIQQFLSPVPVNATDNAGSQHTDEKHQAFLKNIFNDPAVKEVGDQMIDVLETIQAEMQNGLSMADARSILAQFGDEVIEPAIQKHHGKHSPSHRTSLHDVEEPELPGVVKRAAMKGRK
ncbi:hypothetical protein CB599_11690 [Salmonella enterica subsp. enterica serovar Adjame]|nr:hypothetical protein [Salmonella enterica subsp. enterica serovar Adjame]